ncbi:MAG: NAD(P)-dependent alcohol dehydrogenase [Thermoplasmatota archaeon]
MQVHAHAAPTKGSTLEPFTYEAEPGPHEVLIRVSHCGICHSDVHLIDDDWRSSQYPLVPGHEVVGTVAEAGDAVLGLKEGDRVGLGWQCGACHACDACARGDENLCPGNQATAVGHHGGFADHVLADARMAFKLPDGLSSEGAAPLLCGGITVYSPLRRLAGPGARVGVIGIGGLGHMGVRFAKALGYEVTAYSGSPDKEDEARALGADHFVSSADGGPKAGPRQDLIINTAYADLDWNGYLRALRPNGTLCFVGVPPSDLGIHAGTLLAGQKRVTASAIGGRALIREMLDFAAARGVEAQTEAFSMTDVNAALEHLRAGKARYRVVLEN